MKLEIWLDSGANIHSKYKQIIDLEDVTGITDEEWNEMTEKEQEETIQPIAFERADWGWKEV